MTPFEAMVGDVLATALRRVARRIFRLTELLVFTRARDSHADEAEEDLQGAGRAAEPGRAGTGYKRQYMESWKGSSAIGMIWVMCSSSSNDIKPNPYFVEFDLSRSCNVAACFDATEEGLARLDIEGT